MVWFLQGYYLIFRLPILLMNLLFNLDYLAIDPVNHSNRGDVKAFYKLLELLESH